MNGVLILDIIKSNSYRFIIIYLDKLVNLKKDASRSRSAGGEMLFSYTSIIPEVLQLFLEPTLLLFDKHQRIKFQNIQKRFILDAFFLIA